MLVGVAPQLVDLLPALQGGLGPFTGPERAAVHPAGAVRGGLLPDNPDEVGLGRTGAPCPDFSWYSPARTPHPACAF